MSNKDWDPTVLDREGQVDNKLWLDAKSSFLDGPNDTSFDEVGNYRFRSNNHQFFFFDTKNIKDNDIDEVIRNFISCKNGTTKSNEPECKLSRPLLNWTP